MVLTKKDIEEIANYYKNKKKLAHIKLKPVGHIDGYIVSELIDNAIYHVNTIEGKSVEIFIAKIYDIKDYGVPL